MISIAALTNKVRRLVFSEQNLSLLLWLTCMRRWWFVEFSMRCHAHETRPKFVTEFCFMVLFLRNFPRPQHSQRHSNFLFLLFRSYRMSSIRGEMFALWLKLCHVEQISLILINFSPHLHIYGDAEIKKLRVHAKIYMEA